MRPIRTTALILLLALAGVTHAQPADDTDAANRALAQAFIAAWNAHDMDDTFGDLLARDVDWVNVDAGHGRGRELVRAGHARVHAGKFKDSVMTLQKVEVAPLSPDIALVHVAWGLRGDTDNDGTPRPPREGLLTWVTVREDGAWRIRASHNTNRNVGK